MSARPSWNDARPVLITGGAGFVATNVAHRLLRSGRPVILFDNLSRAGVEQNVEWLRATHGRLVRLQIGDIRDFDAVNHVARQAGRVFHFAAQVAVTTSLVDPFLDFDVNARGTLNLLEAVRACDDPPPVLFTSTNKVYGDLEDVGLQKAATRYQPSRHAAAPGDQRGALPRLPQPVWLLEGCRRAVRARLRTHVQSAYCRLPYELHLRAAPVRHRGPGLGRALPDSGDAGPAAHDLRRRPAGARHPLRPGPRRRDAPRTGAHRRRLRAGVQHRRRSGERHEPRRAARSDRRTARRAPAGGRRAVAAGRSALLRVRHPAVPAGHRVGPAHRGARGRGAPARVARSTRPAAALPAAVRRIAS